jgi:hypothetical protein
MYHLPERDMQMVKLLVLRPAPLEGNAMMDLSPDEIRFLEVCDPCWFDLDREKISTIVSAAYKLLSDLLPERDADLLVTGAAALT